MAHFTYSKFTLEARKARLKLTNQLEPWEWYQSTKDPDAEGLSDAKRMILQMDEILRTADPTEKQNILDTIEDLTSENKIKLAELLGLKYDPIYIGEFE